MKSQATATLDEIDITSSKAITESSKSLGLFHRHSISLAGIIIGKHLLRVSRVIPGKQTQI
jgi:hypothetical protein